METVYKQGWGGRDFSLIMAFVTWVKSECATYRENS